MDGLLAAVYIAALIAYGIRRGGQAVNYRDFAGTGAEPPLLIITASMCASFIGGGFSLGNAERAFAEGPSNTLLLLGFSLGQLLVGLLLAPRFSRFSGISTAGGIIGCAYGNVPRILCGLLSVIFCTGVLAAQIKAIGSVAGSVFSLPTRVCAVIGLLVILLYSTLGGLRASLKSDALQILALAVGLMLTLAVALMRLGGFSGLAAVLPAGHLDITGGQNSLALLGIFLTFMLGEMLCPPSAQRMLLSKNPARTRGATLLSAVISVPFFAVTGLIGLASRALRATNNAAYAIPALVRKVLGFPLGPVICAAMLCIYLSSGGSFLGSCSAALLEDVLTVGGRAPRDDIHKLSAVRTVNVLCGLLALLVALFGKNVLSILVLSYSFWAPVVLIPLSAALFGHRARSRVFIIPALVAAAALLGWLAAGTPFDIPPVLIGFTANAFAFGLVSMIENLETKRKCNLEG